jgi:hypothetical protein
VPGVDHTIELQDLRFKHPQLGTECGDTRNLGHPILTWIRHDP